MLDGLMLKLKAAGLSLVWPVYEFLADGNSRYFWLYCATGIALAAWVHSRRQAAKSFDEVFFDSEAWLGRSALNDYFILFAGAMLRMTILSWAFISAKPVADWVAGMMRAIGVTGTVIDGSAVGFALALTVILFVVDDFLRYVVHLAMHRVPELWEYHKVHHSAEELNFATAERFHPVETVLTSFAVVLGVGTANGLFIAFFGDKLTPLTLFGANVFLFLFNVVGGVLRHAPVWVSFGPQVEKWVISPAMHQIHHSDDPKHFDTNMGGSLAIWDRLFGTLYLANDRSEIAGFGIGAETKDFRSLWTIYLRPFEQSFLLLCKRLGIGAKPAETKISPAE